MYPVRQWALWSPIPPVRSLYDFQQLLSGIAPSHASSSFDLLQTPVPFSSLPNAKTGALHTHSPSPTTLAPTLARCAPTLAHTGLRLDLRFQRLLHPHRLRAFSDLRFSHLLPASPEPRKLAFPAAPFVPTSSNCLVVMKLPLPLQRWYFSHTGRRNAPG